MSLTFLAKSSAYSWKMSFDGHVLWKRMLIGPCALTTLGAATGCRAGGERAGLQEFSTRDIGRCFATHRFLLCFIRFSGVLDCGLVYHGRPGREMGNSGASTAATPLPVKAGRAARRFRGQRPTGTALYHCLGDVRGGRAIPPPPRMPRGALRQSPPTNTSSRLLRMDGQDGDHDQYQRQHQQAAAERPVDEGHEAAARDHQRLAQLLLHQLAEHEAQQQRRRLEAELDRGHSRTGRSPPS